MNAGAFGGETWTHVRQRRDHRPQRRARTLRAAGEYQVSYRHVQSRRCREEWFLGRAN